MRRPLHCYFFSAERVKENGALALLIFASIFFITPSIAQNGSADKLVRSEERNAGDNTLKSISFSSSANLRAENAQQLFKKYLNIDEVNQLVFSNATHTRQQTTIDRYVQYYKGIKVASGGYAIMSKDGIVQFMTGNFYHPDNALPAIPSVDEHSALESALKHTGAKKYMWQEPGIELLLKEQSKKEDTSYYPKGSLVWIEDLFGDAKDRKLHLAWAFDVYAMEPVSREIVYIDAQTGKVLFANALLENTSGSGPSLYSGAVSFQGTLTGSINALHDATRGGGINTYSYGTGSGATILEVGSSSSTWASDAALDVHWGSEKVYDYWHDVQGRNSIDNAGLPINSYTHYLTGYNNAFWDGSKMVYGDGSGIASGGFSPLTALDVCAHEIGHGICQHTAGLAYNRESGAMNEGFSDIWGAIIEDYSDPHETDAVAKNMWTVGEEISASGLRRMDNPNLKTQPDTYGGTYWYSVSSCVPSASNDYCGVHTNSGVMNYWFYLLTGGGAGTNDLGNTFSVTGIGSAKAANIAYQTELVLTPDATYADCRTASINVAITLYGDCSAEVSAVTKAWYAVGVGPDYTGASIGVITGPGSVCEGASITLTDAAPGGTWSSPNATVSVASTGIVTGVSGGTAIISYAMGLCATTKLVTVYPTSAGTITGPSIVCIGFPATFTGTEPWGTWSSSAAPVATVGTGGVVTGLTSGAATITYSVVNSCTTAYATQNITVAPSPTAISGPSAVCVAGTISLVSTPTGGVWTSGSPSIATVAATGLVTGIAGGIAVITYTSGSCAVTKTVTVDILSAGTITGPASLSPGMTITFTSTVSGGTWGSSNPSIITISASSGSATGIASGTTVISYTVTNSCGTSVATKIVSVSCPSGAGIVTTILGTGTPGAGTLGGPGLATSVHNPWGVAADAAGNVYVCDYWNDRVLKISLSGIVTTFAGTGVPGFVGDGGPAIAAQLAAPTGLAIFGSDVYIVDSYHSRIRKVNAAGIISTVVGNGSAASTGDGGPALLASIYTPNDLCFDAAGNMYITEQFSQRVRKVNTSGIISTFAGTGGFGYSGDGGPAIAAQMQAPDGVTADNAGNLYISEFAGNRVRKVDPSGIITTYAGGGLGFDGGPAASAYLGGPTGLDVDNAGNLLICEANSDRIRKVNAATGIISTIAGTGTGGFNGDGLAPTLTQFNSPHRINCDANGYLYIADSSNHRIRKIVSGAATISGPVALCQGTTTTLTATPAGGTWSSSATGVATVGVSSSIVTGISSGTAVISYLPVVGCVTFTTITVNPAPPITPSPLALCAGSTSALSSSTAGGTWTSSNPGIAGVGISSGLVSAISPGTSLITYSITGGCSNTVSVTVESAVDIHAVHLPTSGLIAWYPFNGNAHNEWAYDEFGAGKNGRPVGPTLTSDRYGNPNKAYYFNGISDHINEDSAFFNIGWPDYTVSAWFNSDVVVNTNNVNSSMVMINSVPHNGFTMTANWLAMGKYSLWANSNPSIATWDILANKQSTAPVVAHVWKHMAMVKTSPTSYSLYINGILDATFTSLVTATNYYTKICLGHIDTTIYTNEGFWGKTDDYAIWRRALSPAEILKVYNGDSASLSICAGGNVTLCFTPLGGTWSSGNSTIATVDANGTVTGISAGTAIITYTKSNACGAAIATRVVTVNPLGAGPITGTPTVCEGLATTLSGSVPGGTWSSDAPGTATVSPGSGIVNGIVAGTATISYKTVFSCGTSVATKVVTVSPQPVAGVITGFSELCQGSYIFLNDTIPGGIWTCTPATVATVSMTGVVIGVGGGTAVVTYSFVNSCGTSYALKTVTVNSLANAGTITGAAGVCVAASSLLSNAVTGGVWTSDLPAIASVSAAGLVTGNGAGTATISYTVTNGCGSVRATKMVTINTLPDVGTITGSATVCVSATTLLSVTIAGGTWSSGASSIASVSSGGLVTGGAAGTAIISYAVTNGCGTAYATKSVTANSLPDAGTITGATNICLGAATLFTNTTSGGVWTSSNASVATISPAGTVFGVGNGTALVSYAVTGLCGTVYATKPISVTLLPDAGSIIGPSSVCVGGSMPFISTVTGGVWMVSPASIATINSSGTVSGISEGTATISYVVSSTCGTALSLATVAVSPASSVGTISGSAIVCSGHTTVFSDPVPGGTWVSASTGIATVNSAGVITGISTGTSVISYVLTNGCGATAATKIVSVNAAPDAGIIGGTGNACIGVTTPQLSTVPGGVWSTAPGGVLTISSAGLLTGVSAGTAMITYTVTSPCNSSYATQVVTVNPDPNAGVISGVPTVCQGYNTSLTSSAGAGIWTTSAASIAATAAAPGVITGIHAGTAIISFFYTNFCGTDATSIVVTVNPWPDAGSIMGPFLVCAGTTILLSDGVSGGNWTSGATTVATVDSTGIVTGVATGTATISYAFTNACGTSMANRIITVNPQPDPGTIFGASAVCAGGAIALGDITPYGTWSATPASVVAVGPTGVVNGINAGVAAVSYSVSNICGTASAVKSVTVNPLPDAGTITGPGNICLGTTIPLSDAIPGGTWSAAGSVATVSSSGAVTGIGIGAAYITYTVTNMCGSGHALKLIMVNTLPHAGSIGGTSSICQGDNTVLTETIPGGVWSGSNTAVATISGSGIVTALSPGTLSVSYTVTNSCGTSTATRDMIVKPQPDPGMIKGNMPMCAGTTMILTNGAPGGVWKSSVPVVASVSGAGSIQALYPGLTIISYSVTNDCGTAAATAVVTVNPLPAVSVIRGQAVICSLSTVVLSDSALGGTWSCSDTSIITLVDAGPGRAKATALIPGTATITYSFTNACGNEQTAKTLTVNPLPDPGSISGKTTVKTGGSSFFTTTVAGGVWTCTPENVIAVDGKGTVKGLVAGTGIITYTISNDCGSAITGSVIIVEQDTPVVKFGVYPNPARGSIIVTAPGPGLFVAYTMEGKEVQRNVLVTGNNQVHLAPHPATAIYMCRYLGDDGSRDGLKLVVDY